MTNDIRKLNTRLAQDLGRVATGQGLYKWVWSEDPSMLHPMRIVGKFDYKAEPDTGLIVAWPVYALRKMCLVADHQWILCHFIESPSESEWRKHFGYSLEWPRVGQYYPTTVVLDPGMEPCIELTTAAIDEIRKQRSVTPEEVERRATETIEKKEARSKANMYDRIRNDLTTYDHVEGTKDSISYPSWGTKEANADHHPEQ
jgi:hypothetical protein